MYTYSATWNSPLGWGGDDTVLVNSESRSFAGAGTVLSNEGGGTTLPLLTMNPQTIYNTGSSPLGWGGWDDTVLVDSRSTKYIQGTASNQPTTKSRWGELRRSIVVDIITARQHAVSWATNRVHKYPLSDAYGWHCYCCMWTNEGEGGQGGSFVN